MISAGDRTSLSGRNSLQIRELPFAACYVYSPSDARGTARLLRTLVKAGRVSALVDRALQLDANTRPPQSLPDFFSRAAILVPVPGSSPSAWGDATASGRVAVALWKHGLGRGVWFGLRRLRAVRKSSTAAPGARPSVQAHFDTLGVEPTDISGVSHVMLVDDVVTRGRTLLAASLRLREVFPGADVRGFALLRTMGYWPVAERFLLPCMGKIEWARDDARRNP